MKSFEDYKREINESKKIDAEVILLLQSAIETIKKHLKDYEGCKIGKTSDIENRFDQAYREQGYVDLLKISQSNSKKVIDRLEERLIKYFKFQTDNKQEGGGDMADTGDYWIYLVHCGTASKDAEKS
jgi:isopenicillin N synthase-like dioxygenase